MVKDASGKEVARTTTDARGRFTIALPPGRYLVASEVAGPFPVPGEAEVTVRAGAYASVELHLDSGIR